MAKNKKAVPNKNGNRVPRRNENRRAGSPNRPEPAAQRPLALIDENAAGPSQDNRRRTPRPRNDINYREAPVEPLPARRPLVRPQGAPSRQNRPIAQNAPRNGNVQVVQENRRVMPLEQRAELIRAERLEGFVEQPRQVPIYDPDHGYDIMQNDEYKGEDDPIPGDSPRKVLKIRYIEPDRINQLQKSREHYHKYKAMIKDVFGKKVRKLFADSNYHLWPISRGAIKLHFENKANEGVSDVPDFIDESQLDQSDLVDLLVEWYRKNTRKENEMLIGALMSKVENLTKKDIAELKRVLSDPIFEKQQQEEVDEGEIVGRQVSRRREPEQRKVATCDRDHGHDIMQNDEYKGEDDSDEPQKKKKKENNKKIREIQKKPAASCSDQTDLVVKKGKL